MVSRRLGQVELREDALDVLLDRADGQDKRRGNGRVRPPLRHQAEHLALARCEPLDRVVVAAAGEQRRDDVGVERWPCS